MMFKRLIFVIFLSVCGFILLQIKYKVQYLAKDVAELEMQLNQEYSAIHILKAEWAYLNQPKRLEVLAKRYLKLNQIGLDHIYFHEQRKKTINNFKMANDRPIRWNFRVDDIETDITNIIKKHVANKVKYD